MDALVEQARQEIQQAGELIDDVLFLGELETGREVVSLGRTLALPIVQEVASAYADRAEHAEITLMVSGGAEIELPLRPRMIRVIVENLVQNAIRYAGPGATCRILVTREGAAPMLVVADDGNGRTRGRAAAAVRALLPCRPGAHVARHRPRPRDREARRQCSGRRQWTRAGAPDVGLEIVCRFPAAP